MGIRDDKHIDKLYNNYKINMNNNIFEWDNKKEEVNIKKHGISFGEAVSVFSDERAVLFDDPDHSENESRFILIGMSHRLNVLIVCHCYRHQEEVIRIISSRKATKREEKQYIDYNKNG